MFHSAYEIIFKLVSNWEQSMLYTKSLQILHRKGIPIITGLKVSSVTCKCVFTDQNLMRRWEPTKLNFENFETYHWKELKEYKRKMGSFVKLSCLLPYLWCLKRQKLLGVFVFSADNSKKFVIVLGIYLSTQRRYWVIAENGVVNRL